MSQENKQQNDPQKLQKDSRQVSDVKKKFCQQKHMSFKMLFVIVALLEL